MSFSAPLSVVRYGVVFLKLVQHGAMIPVTEVINPYDLTNLTSLKL